MVNPYIKRVEKIKNFKKINQNNGLLNYFLACLICYKDNQNSSIYPHFQRNKNDVMRCTAMLE